VSWMFSRKGLIIIPKEEVDEDDLMEIALESGAEDMKLEDENYEVFTAIEDFDTVLNAIKSKNIKVESAEISMIPSTYIKLEGKHAQQMLKLSDKIEDLDDVQSVWSNFDISDEEIEEYNKS